MRATLKLKTMAVFILALALSVSMILISSYYMTVNHQRQEYIRYNSGMLELASENLSSRLYQVLESSLTIYRDDKMMNILRGVSRDLWDTSTIRDSLRTIFSSNPYICQVYLYSDVLGAAYLDRGNATAQGTAGGLMPGERYPYNSVSLSGKMQTTYGFALNVPPDREVITMSRSIYDFPGERYLGELDIDIDPAFFGHLEDIVTDGAALAFVSGDGTILYSSDADSAAFAIIDDLVLSGSSGVSECSHEGHKHTAVYSLVKPNASFDDFYIIKIIADEAITASARELAIRNLMIGGLILFFAVLAMAKISSGFARPFDYIDRQLKRISEGNLTVKLDIRNDSEFGVFARQFNAMIDSINNLIIRDYKLEISNKNNQLKALQAQMDPHFINNALQNIGAEALRNGNRQLYDPIMQFGEMMRYTMDFASLMVPLEKEMRYTVNYLNLQAMRFRGRFRYSISSEDDSLRAIVPKLLLQPLAENVFKHGRFTDDRVMMISIASSLRDGVLRVECSNDGEGIDRERLARLRSIIDRARFTDEESSHIGLINLSRRLWLIYGERGSIHIVSDHDKGFTVSIEIEGVEIGPSDS